MTSVCVVMVLPCLFRFGQQEGFKPSDVLAVSLLVEGSQSSLEYAWLALTGAVWHYHILPDTTPYRGVGTKLVRYLNHRMVWAGGDLQRSSNPTPK